MINLPKEYLNNFQTVLRWCIDEWNSKARVDTFNLLQDKNISTIWDIGANFGVFTDICLTRFPNAIINAFEPDPINCGILQSNFGTHPRVIIHTEGIYYGTQTGHPMLPAGDTSPGGYVFSALPPDHLGLNEDPVWPGAQYYKTMIVNDAVTFHMKELEELFTVAPDLIKTDVEGSEYNIIEHSKLFKESPYLIIEFHNHIIEYVQKFIRQYLPMYTIEITTNEGYGSAHHWYTFLSRV